MVPRRIVRDASLNTELSIRRVAYTRCDVPWFLEWYKNNIDKGYMSNAYNIQLG
jgi:hypothetical protein